MDPNARDLPARAAQRADAFRHLRAGLALPLIAAPMFLASGTALVGAACRAGIVGASRPRTAAARSSSTSGCARSATTPGTTRTPPAAPRRPVRRT
jgi:hypothetical protein